MIGAAKSATTSLADWIGQHPEIFVPPSKESHFFTSDAYYSLGLETYLKNEFSHAASERVLVDASPSYLHLPDRVIPRMKQCLVAEELRFLVLLRNPIERAFSHYLHQRRRGRESMAFEDAVRDELAGNRQADETWLTYLADGRYAAHLRRWFSAFGREVFLVIRYEDLRDRPREVISRVFSFLDLEDVSDEVTLSRRNEARAPRFTSLARWIGSETGTKKLLRKLLPYRVQRHLYRESLRLLERPLTDRPRISQDTEARLSTIFEPDLRDLESMLGWSVESWRRST